MDTSEASKKQMPKRSLLAAFVPHPPAYSSDAGLNYASQLAQRTQALSLAFLIPGWMLVIIAALLAVLGAVFGSSLQSVTLANGAYPVWQVIKLHPGLMSSIAAIIVGGIGWQLVDRARAASRVASVATSAIRTATSTPKPSREPAVSALSPDRAAYDACVDAKVAWLESRMSLERLDGIVSTLNQSMSTKGK